MIKVFFVKRNRSYILKSITAWKNEKLKIEQRWLQLVLTRLFWELTKTNVRMFLCGPHFFYLYADFVGVLNSGVLVHGVPGKKRSVLHMDFQWSP